MESVLRNFRNRSSGKSLFDHSYVDNVIIWNDEDISIEPHFHSFIEIMYVLDGEITTTINTNTETLAAGDIAVALSSNIHYYTTPNHSKMITLLIPEIFVHSFSCRTVGETLASPFLKADKCSNEILYNLNKLLIDDFNRPIGITHNEDSSISGEKKMLVSTLNESADISQAEKNLNYLKNKGYVYTVLSLLVENIGMVEIERKKVDDLPQKILAFLLENFQNERLTLEDISNHFGYNKCYFSTFFNQYFGFGIIEYINFLKVRHAANAMMANQDLSIWEIASNAGFTCPRTFNRSFFNIYGVSPGKYRDRK